MAKTKNKTYNSGYSDPAYGAVPPTNSGTGTVIISSSNATATYTASSVTVKPNTHSNVTFTTGTGISSPWATTTTAGTNSTKLNLDGADADIVINGHSLTKTLQALEERLNILVPNPELEREWAELKQLGDAYRKLEADLTEKAHMWQALQKTS
jgi:hypothetical protein